MQGTLRAKVPVSGQQRQCAHQFIRSPTRSSMVMDGAVADCSLVPRCESPAPMVVVAATVSAGGSVWRVAGVEMLSESARVVPARHSCPSDVWADQRIKNLHANFRSSYRCCQLNSKAISLWSYCLARLSMASTLRSPVMGVSPPPSTPPRLGSFGFALSFPLFFAPAGGRLDGGGMAALLALATAARVSLAPLPLSTMNGCAVFSCDCVAGDRWMHRAHVTVYHAQVGHCKNCGM